VATISDAGHALAALIEPVARLLLGEPNTRLSSDHELRYGSRGSFSIDLQKGVWHDHETGEGGGVLDLVQRETGLTEARRCVQWLEEAGFDLEREQPPRKGKPKPKDKDNGKGSHFNIVATYDYTDEIGHLLFQVCRLDPKDFRQRKPDHGGWSWSVRGVRNVPYRLPELLEQLAEQHVVFVVEGEKDANNLWQLGIPATTNAGGAGKWRAELNEFFSGADVVIIEDNDPQKKHPKTGELMFHDDGRPILPGQDHAQAVAAALDGIATRVRVLKLVQFWPAMPLKGDVSDWLEHGGGSPEMLFEIIEQLPDWRPPAKPPEQQPPPPEWGELPAVSDLPPLDVMDLVALQGVPVPLQRWQVPGLVPSCNVSLLSGDGGIGKTLLMQQLAVATVLGRDWIGLLPEPGPVLLISAEDDVNEIHFRLDKIIRRYGASWTDLKDLHIISLAGKDAAFAVAGNNHIVKPTLLWFAICELARRIRPKMIGIDTAADVFLVEERDRAQARQCISLLRGLSMEVNAATLLLSHPSLHGIQSGSGQSGSTGWNNSVRSRLYLYTPQDDEIATSKDIRVLETKKANYTAHGQQVRLKWNEGLFELESSGQPQTAYDKASVEQRALSIFKALLNVHNNGDIPVSATMGARNYAPTVFARMDQAKLLAPNHKGRMNLLRDAMYALLKTGEVANGQGPAWKPPSKQTACLYTVKLPEPEFIQEELKI